MSLDMTGHIDSVFESATVTRWYSTDGQRDASTGLWVDGKTCNSSHVATIQPASMREVDLLSQGGERLKDVRHIWINDGTATSVLEADLWEFEGQTWRCIGLDNRTHRNYCKVTVSRLDIQSRTFVSCAENDYLSLGNINLNGTGVILKPEQPNVSIPR